MASPLPRVQLALNYSQDYRYPSARGNREYRRSGDLQFRFRGYRIAFPPDEATVRGSVRIRDTAPNDFVIINPLSIRVGISLIPAALCSPLFPPFRELSRLTLHRARVTLTSLPFRPSAPERAFALCSERSARSRTFLSVQRRD